MKNKVWVKKNMTRGIGVVVGSTMIKDELKEVRVYFEREKTIASFKPEELVIVHEEDN